MAKRAPSMHPIAVKSRERRAREKAERGAQATKNTTQVVLPVDSESLAAGLPGASDGTLEVEVVEPGARPKQSFKDRMLARFVEPAGSVEKTKKPAAKKSGKKVEINFLTKSLPLISGLVASNAQNWFADEYKDCAPKRAEVVGILAPLINIVERRIQITGEMSEDAVDLIACGTSALGYSGRLYVTYSDIKRGRLDATQTTSGGERATTSESARYDGASTDPATRESALIAQFGRSADSAPAISGYNSNSDQQPGGHFDGLQAQDDAQLSAGSLSADVSSDKAWQLATVANAFRRDHQYRSQNGLL